MKLFGPSIDESAELCGVGPHRLAIIDNRQGFGH